jgi:hypothetical protein
MGGGPTPSPAPGRRSGGGASGGRSGAALGPNFIGVSAAAAVHRGGVPHASIGLRSGTRACRSGGSSFALQQASAQSAAHLLGAPTLATAAVSPRLQPSDQCLHEGAGAALPAMQSPVAAAAATGSPPLNRALTFEETDAESPGAAAAAPGEQQPRQVPAAGKDQAGGEAVPAFALRAAEAPSMRGRGGAHGADRARHSGGGAEHVAEAPTHGSSGLADDSAASSHAGSEAALMAELLPLACGILGKVKGRLHGAQLPTRPQCCFGLWA